MRLTDYCIACSLLVLNMGMQALQSDNNAPFIATSGNAKFIQLTRTGIYRDHVVVTQGSTRLTADQVTVQLDAHNQVDSAIALGAPATFSLIPHVNDQPAIAHAQRIDYYPTKNQLVLLGDAWVMQNHDSYHAEKIYYDILTKEVRTPKELGKQVTIVIKPKPKSKPVAPIQSFQNNPL